MRYSVTFLLASLLFFYPNVIYADDSTRNPIALKLKKSVQKKVDKQLVHYSGYCDVVVYFHHTDKHAVVEKVNGTGDAQICRFAKQLIKVGSKFRYKVPERMIVIHISS
ncbi:hypothetical protein LZU85_14055 [Vibrio sp. IRLE0018]|uniref:hypothetical protein n=1 Tax=Vibrio floridensis TaxID=2908007 RepID=UPI001F166D4D|nr:hypothetical protein [Vibrio floridensis]MCF8779926.1 hypothetical protein [Vibrio floridensis]